MDKERQINPRSLENLKLGAKARDKGKIRRNTTLLPETIEWLDKRGNASDLIDQLVQAAKSGELKPNNAHEQIKTQQELYSNDTHEQIKALQALVTEAQEQLRQEREIFRQELAATQASQLLQPDLEELRDRYLTSLRLGKQAPEYKRTRKALDGFIAFVQSI